MDSCIFYNRKAIEAVANTAFSTKSIKPAKRLLDIFENRNSDSAIRYLKLYNASNDSLFSARATQQTQAMILEDELRQEQLKVDAMRAEERRRINLQYVILAIGIVTIIIFYLLISRSVVVHHRIVEFFGVIALLIVFEFLNLLLHPFLERITNHSPLLMLGALVCIAALLVPLHHRLQKWATNVLVEKNKKIRLEAARRTINELEQNNK